MTSHRKKNGNPPLAAATSSSSSFLLLLLLIRAQAGARLNTSGGALLPAPEARCLGLLLLSGLLPHPPRILRVSAGEEAKHRESPHGAFRCPDRSDRFMFLN